MNSLTVSRTRSGLARCLLGAALLAGSSFPALARPSSAVQDGANVLSKDTITKVQEMDDEIFRATGKDLLVVTKSTLDGSPQSEADNIFRRENLNGMLIFMVPDKRELGLIPGQKTQMIFPKSRLSEIRESMKPSLRVKNYDKAIIDGAGGIRTTFFASAPAARQSVSARPANNVPVNNYRPAPQPQPADSGIGIVAIIFMLGAFIVGVMIIAAIVRAITGRGGGGSSPGGEWNSSYGGQPQGYGVAPGGGGGPGLLGTLAAGIGGAVVGNAVYDAFTHRNEPQVQNPSWGGGGYEQGGPPAPSEPAWTGNDAGVAGSGDSSSWGDSGSAGGGGGDSGGGGDWG